MSLAKSGLFVFVSAGFLTFFLIFSIDFFRGPGNSKAFFSQFFTEGYDFRKFQNGDEDFAKYRVGSRIDLDKLISTGGAKVPHTTQNELVLLNVIDPQCGYCQLARDIVTKTRRTSDELGIAYIPVLFTPAPKDVNLAQFAQSLGFEDCFLWEPN